MNTLAPTAELALREVRDLSEGNLTHAPQARRRITYQLTRAGRPLHTMFEVRNAQALPIGLRLLFWKP